MAVLATPLSTLDDGGVMRWGDYILCVSIVLNSSMVLAYLFQGFYAQACYWAGALTINLSLLWQR